MALRAKGKHAQADMVKNIVWAVVECIFVKQSEQLGHGHAVLCAERALGSDPFAVLLADSINTQAVNGSVKVVILNGCQFNCGSVKRYLDAIRYIEQSKQ